MTDLLSPEIRWFFNQTVHIFPRHIRALWVNDRLIEYARPSSGRKAEMLFGRFVSDRPSFVLPGQIVAVPLTVPDAPPAVGRYVGLTSSSMAEFVFGFVSVSLDVDGPMACIDLGTLAFTPRERQVALRMALGVTLTDIAQADGCSPNTIRTLLKNAMRKADCRTQQEFQNLILSITHHF